MAVFRVEKNKNYTTMSNYHLKDDKLSLKSKGLLSLILSLPDDWNYTIAGLVSLCVEGESSIKSALNELKKSGYIEIIKIKPNKENGGRYEYVYNVYEKPVEKQEDRKQGVENQPLENQPVENQGVENHPIYKRTNISNTNIPNKDILRTNNKKTHRVIKAFPCLESLEGISEELLDTLNDFAAMRKKIKAPMTDRGMKILMNKLQDMSNGDVQTMIALLNQSIMNSWKSVYPIKNDGSNQAGHRSGRLDWIDDVNLSRF